MAENVAAARAAHLFDVPVHYFLRVKVLEPFRNFKELATNQVQPSIRVNVRQR
jgi:hypothetical protein